MSEKEINIGGRSVGGDRPVFVIAEIGINHNGDLATAKALVDVAHQAGADAVKFQKREPELSVPSHLRDSVRDTPWGSITYLDYRLRMEFSLSQYVELRDHATGLGLEFLASAWDEPSLDFLARVGVPSIKIASACLTDHDLLREAKRQELPVILSTGMSTMTQIDEAVNCLEGSELLIAHSTSAYPCPIEELNLRMLPVLANRFNCVVGYSGHEVGIPTTVAAVALGAKFVERHITLSRAMWGSDQAASVEPEGLAKLVRHIRTVEVALGDGSKKVYESEMGPMSRLRRFV